MQRSDESKAMSQPHAEYAIAKHLLTNHDISNLAECMAVDTHSDGRFTKAAKVIMDRLQNICDTRRHRLPKTHPDYREKVND